VSGCVWVDLTSASEGTDCVSARMFRCMDRCVDATGDIETRRKIGVDSVSAGRQREGRMVIALDECHSKFVLRGKENSAGGSCRFACVLLWQEGGSAPPHSVCAV
jgi:hypothetical protein